MQDRRSTTNIRAGGDPLLPKPHFEKAKSKNRIEPVSNPSPSGGHVRPEKAAAVAGDNTQTAGLSQPHGGDEAISKESLDRAKNKKKIEPKPGHTGGPAKYPDGSTTTKTSFEGE